MAAIRDHAVHGRLLDVPIIVITSAADEAGVTYDTLTYLKAFGRAESCTCMRIWTSEQEGWSKRLADHESRT